MLRDAGMTVSVLATIPVRFDKVLRLPRPSLAVEDGIPTVRVYCPTFPPGFGLLERLVHSRLIRRAVELLRPHGTPDVVHAHTVFPGATSGLLVSQQLGRPLVITEHRPSSISASGFLRRSKQIRRAVAAASVLATVSSRFAQALREHYGTGAWEEIELPVPNEFFEIPRSSSGSVCRFVHVSHLDSNKRPIEMCRAFVAAFAGQPGAATLDVVGGDEAALQELREAIGPRLEEAGIVLHGYCDRKKTAKTMAASDVFVLVSAVEAGGTVFSEAQAAGLRVVASDTWAGDFAVRPGVGEIVPVDDHAALVAALRATANPAGYLCPEEIRERARRRYSAASFTARWEKLYQEAVG